MKALDLGSVIRHPISTEKAIRLMEAENVLVFVVDMRATKPLVKQAVEKAFASRVVKVRTLVNRKGQKVAYVKFGKTSPAIDIATNLGLI